MIDTKHTPGPWNSERAESSKCFDVKCECGFFVATCHDGVRGESNAEANARLISAAPELLEALQRLSDQCTRLRMAWQLESDAERTARVVIAKAIGDLVDTKS